VPGLAPLTQVTILAPALLYREAWRALLANQPGILVAGTASTVDEASRLVGADARVTVLIDFPISSPELVRQIRTASQTAGILCLVASYELGDILLLLQAGANGCLTRDAPVADLTRAITAVARAELVLPPDVAARALAILAHHDPPAERSMDPLSERETEVLQLLARGLTNKDVAQSLMVSVRTVEAHLRSIYSKLGVRSRTEAALWAIRHGYGPAPE